MRCDKDLPLGQKKMASISSFKDYPMIPRTFTLKLVLYQCPPNYQQIFKQITSLKIKSNSLKIRFLKSPTVDFKICKVSDFVHLSKSFKFQNISNIKSF